MSRQQMEGSKGTPITSRQQVIESAQRTPHLFDVQAFARDLIVRFNLPCDHTYRFQVIHSRGDCMECGQRVKAATQD